MNNPPGIREDKSRRRYSAPAAACAADLLFLVTRSPEPQSAAEMARSLGLSRSLVFRVVQELEARELLRRTESNRFSLGLGALEIGGAYAASADYVESTRTVLRELARMFGEIAHLGVLRGADVLFIMNQEAPNAIIGLSYAGKRIPANCTALGKALLARLPDHQVEARFGGHYPRLTPRSIDSFKVLQRELERVRAQGYATVDGDAIPGRFAVSMCVEISGLDEAAALAVSGSSEGFRERCEEVVAALMWARERLHREGSARTALDGTSTRNSVSWDHL